MVGPGQPSWNSAGQSIEKDELRNVSPAGNAYEDCLLRTWPCSTGAGNGLEIPAFKMSVAGSHGL